MDKRSCCWIVWLLTLAVAGYGGESGPATLQAVRELVSRNEAMLNPIKMAYAVTKSRTGERPQPIGGKRQHGRPFSRVNCIWAQAGDKHYAREDYFYGPNEPARSSVKVIEPERVTEGRLPDLMEGTIRARDEHDWYSVLVAKLGLRPFEGGHTLSQILVPQYASLHEKTEMIEGRETCVIDAKRPSVYPYFARIWLDRQRGMPLRIWYFDKHPDCGDARCMSEINDIKLHRLPNGGWVPIEGVRSLHFSDDGVSYEHITVDVNSITIRGEDIPESLFRVDFPNGARIYNSVSGLSSVQGRVLKTYEQVVRGGAKYIAGTVVDENGAPVPEVVVRPLTVIVRQSDGRSMLKPIQARDRACAMTDANGRFAIELEEEGTYEFWVFPEDFVDMRVRDIPLGRHDLKITLRKGGTVTGRVVRTVKGKKVPVPDVEVMAKEAERVSFTTIRFGRMRAETDSEGRFQIKYLDMLMPKRRTKDPEPPQYVPRAWQISCGSASETVVFEDGESRQEVELELKPDLSEAIPLVGRPMPDFGGIEIDPAAHQLRDKMLLVCFFDMQQRPSRNSVMQLARQAEPLRQKGISIVAVQTTKIDENTLRKWVSESNIPFPVGIIQGDEDDICFNWAVRLLPWLILTDREQFVRAEGFGLTELEDKIKAANE